MLPTRRLDLIPATLEHLAAELQVPSALGPLIGVPIPEAWPPGEYDRHAIEYFHKQLQAGGPPLVGWYAWYAVSRNAAGQREALVASAGYFGPPAGGVVEIGYSVLPSARGQGYATEIVQALVQLAFQHPEVQEVLAHTSDTNIGSTKVLLRSGFKRVGLDPEREAIQYRLGR